MLKNQISSRALMFAAALSMLPANFSFAQALDAQSQENLGSTFSADAKVPRLIKFSGSLRDVDGKKLQGAASVTFSIYTESVGGEALWSEKRVVNVDGNGQYSVLLGAVSTEGVPLDVFSSGEARWLGVQAEGHAELPRSVMVSVPYALKAADAESLGGHPIADFQLRTTSSGTSAPVKSLNQLSASAAGRVPESTSTVDNGSGGTANQVAKFTGVSTIGNSLLFDDGSNVGVGTTTPGQKLEVNGNVKLSVAPENGGIAAFNVGGFGVFRAGLNMQFLMGAGDTTKQGSFFTMDTRPSENVLSIWTRPANVTSEFERITIQSGGNVGIGKTNPSSLLDVGGNVGVGGTLVFNSAAQLAGFRGFNLSNDGVLRNGVNMPNLLGMGDINRQGAFLTMDTRASQSAFSLFTRPAGSATEFERMTVLSTGNIGVNNIAPVHKLHVIQDAPGVGSFPVSTPPPSGVVGDARAGSGFVSGVSGITSSPDGLGLVGENLSGSGNAIGIFGVSAISPTGVGVWGESTVSAGFSYGVYGHNTSNQGTGVIGFADVSAGDAVGVYGKSRSAGGTGVWGQTTNTSGINFGVYGSISDVGASSAAGTFDAPTGGNILQGRNSTTTGRVFRVDFTGKGFFNGGSITGGADFAESVSVGEERSQYEPGDLIAIDSKGIRRFTKVTQPYSTLVAGIYSTKPGVLATPHNVDDLVVAEKEIPLAVVGIVPCKVTNENGAIHAGDLLVSSSKPGYAMRGTERKRMTGAVVGKALQSMEGSSGVIEVLVSLQ